MLLSDFLLPLSPLRVRERVEFGELPIDGLLELEVENDSLHVAAFGSDALRFVLVKTVKSGVVPSLTRFDETMVEDLTSVHVEGPVALNKALGFASQGQIDGVLRVRGPGPDKALAEEVFEVAPGLVGVPTVTVARQIVQGDSPKRPNFGEGPEFRVTKVVGAVTLGLAVWGPPGTRTVKLKGSGMSGAGWRAVASVGSAAAHLVWSVLVGVAVGCRRPLHRFALVVKVIVAPRACH